MPVTYDGNFAFLKIINKGLYEALRSAEAYSRIDLKRCCQDCRTALEIFINSVCDKYGLTDKYGKADLVKKVEVLQD